MWFIFNLDVVLYHACRKLLSLLTCVHLHRQFLIFIFLFKYFFMLGKLTLSLTSELMISFIKSVLTKQLTLRRFAKYYSISQKSKIIDWFKKWAITCSEGVSRNSLLFCDVHLLLNRLLPVASLTHSVKNAVMLRYSIFLKQK